MLEFITRTIREFFSQAATPRWDDDEGHTRFASGDDDASATPAPAFNIDGTPMVGSVDANGQPYGFPLSAHSEPAFNLDGTPMLGDFDSYGRMHGDISPTAYDIGSTGSYDDSFGSGSSWSSSDSFGSSCSFGGSDSFGSF